MSVRLPVDPSDLAAGELCVAGDRLHYLRKVLRLTPGDALELFDGAGRRAAATVVRLTSREGTLAVEAPRPGIAAEPRTRLALLFGVPRGDAADRVVRAGTEVGVARFVPVLTTRGVARPAAGRRERWARVAAQAARQSGRSTTPEIEPPQCLADALASVDAARSARLVAWEEERSRSLASALSGRRPASAALLVGPEGGLTQTEVQAAEEVAFVPVSLGPRVLRAATAAIIAPALLLHRLGDLG